MSFSYELELMWLCFLLGASCGFMFVLSMSFMILGRVYFTAVREVIGDSAAVKVYNRNCVIGLKSLIEYC